MLFAFGGESVLDEWLRFEGSMMKYLKPFCLI